MTKEGKTLLKWDVTKEKKDSNTILLIIFVFISTAAAAAYFVYEKEYLNGLVFVVLFLVLIWYFFASPRSLSVSILEDGFKINDQFYKFENFKSYWVSSKTGVLYFQSKGKIGSMVSIPGGIKDIKIIKQYIPEDIIETEDRGDDFSNRISSTFKI